MRAVQRFRTTPPTTTHRAPLAEVPFTRLSFTPSPTTTTTRLLRKTPTTTPKPPESLISIRTTPPFRLSTSAFTIQTTTKSSVPSTEAPLPTVPFSTLFSSDAQPSSTSRIPSTSNSPSFGTPTLPFSTLDSGNFEKSSTSSVESTINQSSSFQSSSRQTTPALTAPSSTTPIFIEPATTPLFTPPLTTTEFGPSETNSISSGKMESITYQGSTGLGDTVENSNSTKVDNTAIISTSSPANLQEISTYAADRITSSELSKISETSHSSGSSPSDKKNTSAPETITTSTTELTTSEIPTKYVTKTENARITDGAFTSAGKSAVKEFTTYEITSSKIRADTSVMTQQIANNVTNARDYLSTSDWMSVTDFPFNQSGFSTGVGTSNFLNTTHTSSYSLPAVSMLWLFFSLTFASLLLLTLLLTVLWRAYIRHYWSAFRRTYCSGKCCPTKMKQMKSSHSPGWVTENGITHFYVNEIPKSQNLTRIPLIKSSHSLAEGEGLPNVETDRLLGSSNTLYKTVIKIPGSIKYYQNGRESSVIDLPLPSEIVNNVKPINYNNVGFQNGFYPDSNGYPFQAAQYPFMNFHRNLFFANRPGYLNDNYPFNPIYRSAGKTPLFRNHSSDKKGSGSKIRGLYPRLSQLSPEPLDGLPNYSSIVNPTEVGFTPIRLDVPDSVQSSGKGLGIWKRLRGKTASAPSNISAIQSDAVLAGDDFPDSIRLLGQQRASGISDYEGMGLGRRSNRTVGRINSEIISRFDSGKQSNATSQGKKKVSGNAAGGENRSKFGVIDEEDLTSGGQAGKNGADDIPLLAWGDGLLEKNGNVPTYNSGASKVKEIVINNEPTGVDMAQNGKAVVIIK